MEAIYLRQCQQLRIFDHFSSLPLSSSLYHRLKLLPRRVYELESMPYAISLRDWSIVLKSKAIGALDRNFINDIGSHQIFLSNELVHVRK